MRLQIYTDASVLNSKVAHAALVVDENDNEYRFSYKGDFEDILTEAKKIEPDNINIQKLVYLFHHKKIKLGKKDRLITSDLLETYAVYNILTKIISLNKDINRIGIYTDSMYTQYRIYNICKKSKCELTELYTMMIRKYMEKYKITVYWIKGHSNNWGNEIVDKMCKGENQDQINLLNESRN